MDFSWIPEFMRELGKVPAGVQVGILGLLYFSVAKFSVYIKQRKAEQSGEPPAPSTHSAVEDLKGELLPDIQALKDEVRDLKEQCQRVADIEIALAEKIDKNTEKMIAIQTNVQNLVNR